MRSALIELLMRGGKALDALLLVPPFGGADRPCLGLHLLQAAALREGLVVRVVYANLFFAAEIGLAKYESVCYAPTTNLLGERLFARAAHGLKPELFDAAEDANYRRVGNRSTDLDGVAMQFVSELAVNWADDVAAAIARSGAPVVGCTSMFEQTNAALAILNRVKLASDAITILGGANCEGEMATGLASIGARVDFFFSGESERTFPAFLRDVRAGRTDRTRPIIEGSVNVALDELPTVDYGDYYEQVDVINSLVPTLDPKQLWLPYESSRGCWWGQKHHCTFCGINGQGMQFRQKSAQRVVEELQQLLPRHPSRRICMVDNIMPINYFSELLPELEKIPGLEIFYEQKANLTREKVTALKQAGVSVIQPGIEALSTPLLKLMRKGVSAKQNILLLKYAREVDLSVNWNLLYGFPGDDETWYREMEELIPSVVHLEPPSDLFLLSIDRFSPYFDAPEAFGITEIKPLNAYAVVFPEHTNAPAVAYHFHGRYSSGSLTGKKAVKTLGATVARWRALWQGTTAPKLLLSDIGEGTYVIYDTRGIAGHPQFEFVDRNNATAAVLGCEGPADASALEWALMRRYCLMVDGQIVPLVIASPPLRESLASSPVESLVPGGAPARPRRAP